MHLTESFFPSASAQWHVQLIWPQKSFLAEWARILQHYWLVGKYKSVGNMTRWHVA